MLPRIYTPQNLAKNREIALEQDASAHLGKVLRMRPGDPLILFNGDGSDYPASIDTTKGRQVTARITHRARNHCESPLKITLVQGISRSERMDYTVQKSVELGVHAIQPLQTQKTAVRLDAERAAKKRQHWQAVAIRACEQCGRSVIPQISPPRTLADWLQKTAVGHTSLLLDPGADKTLASIVIQDSCTLIIGPESGFSDAETRQLAAAGARPTAMGTRILRTETTAVAAIAILQAHCGDLR